MQHFHGISTNLHRMTIILKTSLSKPKPNTHYATPVRHCYEFNRPTIFELPIRMISISTDLAI